MTNSSHCFHGKVAKVRSKFLPESRLFLHYHGFAAAYAWCIISEVFPVLFGTILTSSRVSCGINARCDLSLCNCRVNFPLAALRDVRVLVMQGIAEWECGAPTGRETPL